MPSSSTEDGMQIDESDEQDEKTALGRDEIATPGSNVTIERDRHW
jgi:hypothetical protein